MAKVMFFSKKRGENQSEKTREFYILMKVP